jgi:hypothetical protein
MIVLLTLLMNVTTHAGVIELGGSANYRASNYDRNNYLRSTSYTAALSYYFWEMCAWEANYTSGYSVQLSKGPSITDAKVKLEDTSEFISVDLVLSLSERDDLIRPYLKLGGGFLTKERYRRIDYEEKEKLSTQRGWVPSAGVGLALGLTRALNLKFGVDAWTSPLKSGAPVTVDYAGRAGAAWIF